MVQIICLANSKKYGDRCIAGIEITTGKWIRPFSNLEYGQIPLNMCLVDGEEPKLLDILEIPLATTGLGYEYENRAILHGKWQKIGQATVSDLIPYCEGEIIHSQWLNSVPLDFIQSLPYEQRRTLQLIKTTKFHLYNCHHSGKWEADFTTSSGQSMRAKITDLNLIEKLNTGTRIPHECLLTISLSQPWRKTDVDEFACWKLIAGVIELSSYDLILWEMQRLGWSIDRGRCYLKQTYNKRSRRELTNIEIAQFLHYLKNQKE
ncbi:hypothetical protein H6G27_33245 [Nostoc linckia FACHB-104]|nr:hypothetical protein [Nostoc linckia FACHB-104]